MGLDSQGSGKPGPCLTEGRLYCKPEAAARGLETWVLPQLAMGLGKSFFLSVPRSPHLCGGEVTSLLFLAGLDQC